MQSATDTASIGRGESQIARRQWRFDPRYYQLAVQSTLLSWGMLFLGFSISALEFVSVLLVAWGAQRLLTRLHGLPANLLSATNSAMSILLLLHADNPLWLILAVLVAIGSKFLVTWNKRHIYNPSNLGIVLVILLAPSAWAAPGQWGQTMWMLLLAAGFGLGLVIGFRRMLASWTFLGLFALMTLAYAAWLGDPLAIPLHQLQNGALLIFAFFMLSDPMTIPRSMPGQLLFGGMVAAIGWSMQFLFYIPNAFLYALALSSPCVLFINRLFPGQAFDWSLFKRREE